MSLSADEIVSATLLFPCPIYLIFLFGDLADCYDTPPPCINGTSFHDIERLLIFLVFQMIFVPLPLVMHVSETVSLKLVHFCLLTSRVMS